MTTNKIKLGVKTQYISDAKLLPILDFPLTLFPQLTFVNGRVCVRVVAKEKSSSFL